ncbi:MAG: hypothetical protein AB7E21_10315, partial [Pseudodonghicola sp.]
MSYPLRAALAVTGLVISPLCAQAQEVIALDEITVETGSEASAQQSQTTVGAEQLETEYQGASLGTILRDIPGVTTQGGGGEGAEMA